MTDVVRAPVIPVRATRERLTGTASSPDGSVVRPASKSKGVAPPANAGEEVALDESSNIVGCDSLDVSFVHFAISDQVLLDEFPQPRRCKLIVLVVVSRHSVLNQQP
jgi:hypothetical protein